MSSKRPVILMAILLALVLAYVARPLVESRLNGVAPPPPAVAAAPLPGKNTVSGLQVHRDDRGHWIASFDYFYTGEPAPAVLRAELLRPGSVASEPVSAGVTLGYHVAQRGTHHIDVELSRPDSPDALTTSHVVAQLHRGGRPVATQRVDQAIDWPDAQTWAFERAMATQSSEQIFNEAVALIDENDRGLLPEAKRRLEHLISKDAQFDRGYIELARVAMKSNWGPEGLHQAENLLASALQIRPDSVNAKILLGYVYTHQGRYKPAEALFAEAARTDTKNLWLWSNWGELLARQGKLDLATQKYREAVTRPRPHDTYDRARLDAYSNLLTLYEQRKDIDAMEALHKQRTEEFGTRSCYGAAYARFALLQRGNSETAIALARQATGARCESEARLVLGMAHYLAWANASGPQRNDSLNKARAFVPASPELLYQLATSERTITVVQQLKTAGESIDQRDNDKLDALAYAFARKDLPAARRLLRLGARPDAPVGADDMPVAMIPVVSADVDGIRVMQQFGVDYSKLRYRGITAIDHAKQLGDRRLIEALDRQSRTL